MGDDLSILGGVSIAHGKNTTANATDVYGVDLTLREQLGSYSAVVWQSEYLYRNKDVGTGTDKQAGLYSELIYQYNNNYSAGLRYDAITKNETDLSSYAGIDTDNLDRYTAELEYKPFPMSRLRLSYTYDRTKIIAGERKNISEVMLSLNLAAGAHGAHSY
ncbi:TonB-dependent receptor [Sulfurimonas sediminis]|uniref:TonB-dependent receptor n=1 Tax=Sulfurimonas sediminis TaxID=2590020 RepID=UPI001D04FCDA|nr:TonB-dependent receptor [Sulfurimonas sediminis]